MFAQANTNLGEFGRIWEQIVQTPRTKVEGLSKVNNSPQITKLRVSMSNLSSDVLVKKKKRWAEHQTNDMRGQQSLLIVDSMKIYFLLT